MPDVVALLQVRRVRDPYSNLATLTGLALVGRERFETLLESVHRCVIGGGVVDAQQLAKLALAITDCARLEHRQGNRDAHGRHNDVPFAAGCARGRSFVLCVAVQSRLRRTSARTRIPVEWPEPARCSASQ